MAAKPCEAHIAEAAAMPDPPAQVTTAPPASQESATPPSSQPYRFPWGKHKGKLLSEIPLDYFRWLKSTSEAYKSNQGMQMAIEQFLGAATFSATQQSPVGSGSSSQPLSSGHSCTPLTPLSSNPSATSGIFVLTFGKHEGKTLEEVPVEYVEWLRKNEAFSDYEALTAAIAEWDKIERVPTSSMPSSQQLSSQPLRTPLAPLSTNVAAPVGPFVLNFGKHKGKTLEEVPADYVAWLKKSDMIKDFNGLEKAIEEWDKVERVYRLGFGKYKGYTLEEVPPTYLNYLHDSDAAAGHDDLRKALAEHKQANAVQQASAASSSKKKKPFDLPSDHTTDYRRYYYNGDRRAGQMWIGCNDALRYFGADAKAMRAAGLSCFNRSQRFWLHQVFAYAKHFGTTKGETPTKALNKFKAKNYNNPRR